MPMKNHHHWGYWYFVALLLYCHTAAAECPVVYTLDEANNRFTLHYIGTEEHDSFVYAFVTIRNKIDIDLDDLADGRLLPTANKGEFLLPDKQSPQGLYVQISSRKVKLLDSFFDIDFAAKVRAMTLENRDASTMQARTVRLRSKNSARVILKGVCYAPLPAPQYRMALPVPPRSRSVSGAGAGGL